MAKRENIDKWSLGYALIKFSFAKRMHDYFYRKQEIVHADKIPKKQSVIIAPNHQNALMDALAFVMGLNFQTVFLARADIFKKDIIVKILTFMKILPVFRIRDGMSNLQKNEEIFDITVNILRRKRNPLLLFPEGNHGDKRRLRPLVKGIFRIAFMAQEAYGDQPGVKIVPAGIDYSHYWKFRQTQLVNFGDPIEVSDYWADYQENPSIAMNKLRDHLSAEMRKVMIDIQTEEYYDLYMGLRSLVGPTWCDRLRSDPRSLYQKFLTDKQMIERLDKCLEKDPSKLEILNGKYKEYVHLRDKLNFRDWVPARKSYPILIWGFLILVSPVVWPLVILGLFNNWVHFFLPPLMKKSIRDTQFYSTAIWGAGFAAIMLYHLILIILSLIFLPNWWIKILYLLTLGSSGIFALGYRKFLVKAWARIRYSWHARKAHPEVRRLKDMHDQLMEETLRILDQY